MENSRRFLPSSRCAFRLSMISTPRISSLLLPLAARRCLSNLFSTDSKSFNCSSVSMISLSRTGSTDPSTCTTLSSSKQRSTCTMASTLRILARNWLPSPSPLLAPLTSPAISTSSTVVGITFCGLTNSSSLSRRLSGTVMVPWLGSIVQNG